MNIEIKRIHSPDVDLKSKVPPHKSDIYFLIELEIGPVGSPSADIFSLIIASQEAAEKRDGNSERRPCSERGIFIVNEFNFEDVLKHLNEIVKKCDNSEWKNSLALLRSHFFWEYDDFKSEDT